jgi:hypothetical protein
VTAVRDGPVGGPRVRPAGRALALAALTALLAASLTACGRALDVAADVARAPGPAGGVVTAASSGSSGPGTGGPVDRLRASLLGPDDLGPGWSSGVAPLPDPATPAPCGGPGTVARFPDALRVGSTVDGPPGFVVQEALSVYRDTGTAQAAFRVRTGRECGRGALHRSSVTIAPVQDLRAEVGGDTASGWEAGSAALDAALVLVQAREAVFAFAYVAPAGTAPEACPDARALSRMAVARTLAA